MTPAVPSLGEGNDWTAEQAVAALVVMAKREGGLRPDPVTDLVLRRSLAVLGVSSEDLEDGWAVAHAQLAKGDR